MSEYDDRPPKFCVSVSSVLVCVAIGVFQGALFLPALNLARELNGEAPILRWLQWLLLSIPEMYGWDSRVSLITAPCATTLILACVILVLRQTLPKRIRRYFPLQRPKRPEKPPLEPILDGRPAILAVILVAVASLALVVAAAHVNVDRTYRRPVVTWEGPLEDFLPWLAAIGWAATMAGLTLGGYSLKRFQSKHNYLAAVAIGLSAINFLGGFIFLAAICED